MQAEGEEGWRQKSKEKTWPSSNKFLYVFLPSSSLTPPPSHHSTLASLRPPIRNSWTIPPSMRCMLAWMTHPSTPGWTYPRVPGGAQNVPYFQEHFIRMLIHCCTIQQIKPVLSPDNGKEMVEDIWTVARLIHNTGLTLMRVPDSDAVD